VTGVPAVRALAMATALALAASSCASSTGNGAPAPPVADADRLDLAAVCPETVVLQSSWYPEITHGGVYELLAPAPRIDAEKKTVTGKLVAEGKDTGVQLEIRAGGPAIGFQQVSAQMYLDTSITLGFLTMDESIALSVSQPTTAVAATLDLDPLVLMWSPDKHPDWNVIADIGQTDTPVLYFEGERTYMDYLTGAGILRRSQVDSSYDGTPARFAASRGEIAVQGFATNEPYLYAHKVEAWNKPIEFQLVNETGYPNYRNALSIRTAEKHALAPCLTRLVPVMQQGMADFLADPEPVRDLILKVLEEYRSPFVYDKDIADHGMRTIAQLGLMGNGRDRTIGDLDPQRAQRMIDIVVPIMTAAKKATKAGLKPGDIATNEFIDPAIGAATPDR
jgi:hypothetical protein